MFKKFNTTTLIIILIVLGAIVGVKKYFESRNGESTFKEEFVKIDTTAVTQVLIYPKAEKGKEIKITKTGSEWELQSEKMKTAADGDAVRTLLANFSTIKSNSLAGEGKASWNDLQVTDTAGSRIKIVTPDKTYDMVIGKFGYNATSRNGITYIRHSNEDAVYAIDGFLSFNVNQGANSWRKKTFVSGNKDNWTNLIFTYPGDSSFVLARQNNQWTVNGQPADSAKTAQYLSELSSTQSSNFVDHYAPAATPLFTLNIQGNNLPAPVKVVAFPADSTQKFILHSSLNADAYFNEAQSHLVEKVFVGKGKFLNPQN